jgi:hypothetical protein
LYIPTLSNSLSSFLFFLSFFVFFRVSVDNTSCSDSTLIKVIFFAVIAWSSRSVILCLEPSPTEFFYSCSVQ